MIHEKRAFLIRLIEDEIKNPFEMKRFFEDLKEGFADSEALIELISLKEGHNRLTFYLKSERAWFDLFGWTMAKVLILLGIISGLFFLFIRMKIDPVVCISLFLFGTVCYYILLHIVILLRFRRYRRRLDELQASYKTRLLDLLDELKKGS